jgi:hypothetical protein
MAGVAPFPYRAKDPSMNQAQPEFTVIRYSPGAADQSVAATIGRSLPHLSAAVRPNLHH